MFQVEAGQELQLRSVAVRVRLSPISPMFTERCEGAELLVTKPPADSAVVGTGARRRRTRCWERID